jgi:hypothetical protein
MKLKVIDESTGRVYIDSSTRVGNIVKYINLPDSGSFTYSMPDMADVTVKYVWQARPVARRMRHGFGIDVLVEHPPQNMPSISLSKSGSNWSLSVTMRDCAGILFILDVG